MAKVKKIAPKWNTIEQYSFDEMMEHIAPILLTPVPEGIRNKEAIEQANYLLGWLANQYAYIQSLHSRMAALTSQARQEKTEQYHEWVQVRDALERIAKSVELKYKATSRMLTIIYGEDGGSRVAGAAGKPTGWAGIPRKP